MSDDNGFVFVKSVPSSNQGGKGRGNRNLYVRMVLPLVHHPNKLARFTIATPYEVAANLRRNPVLASIGRWKFDARRIEGQGFLYVQFLGPPSAKR